MLLKKCKKIPGSKTFVRKIFGRGDDMCNRCCLNWRNNDECGDYGLEICERANFNGILFSTDYKFAYVVEKV